MKGIKTFVANIANRINQPHYLEVEAKKLFNGAVQSDIAKRYWGDRDDSWQSTDNMPMDGTAIQRWHSLWDCPITVMHKPGISQLENCIWVEKTLSNSWPENTFLPCWKPVPATPSQCLEKVLTQPTEPKKPD